MLHKQIICFLSIFFFQISIFSQQQVIINEFVSSNVNGLIDSETGEYEDWIELYNTTNLAIDISGYTLTDDLSQPAKWIFPNNTVIDAESFLIIWADAKGTGIHASFRLVLVGNK